MARSILDDLKDAKEEINAQVRGEEVELPAGADPVAVDEATLDVVKVDEAEVVAATVEDEENDIRIGDQVFKSQKDAIDYAQKLEREKLFNEAHNMGIREAIQQLAPKPEAVVAPPEFTDEEFYTDPSAALKKAKDKAKEEAKAEIKKELADERNAELLWDRFLTKYPDIDRQDAQRILTEQWSILGVIADESKAMEMLAQKTRAEYQRIVEKMKPRSELPKRSGQVVSTGANAPTGVTPARQAQKVLTMTEQMKTLRRR